MILEVAPRLRNCSCQGLDGDTGQFELLGAVGLLGTDVADHGVEDHADLLLVKLLVDVLVEELAEEAKGLDGGEADVEVVVGRVVRHALQKVVPAAVRDFKGRNNC